MNEDKTTEIIYDSEQISEECRKQVLTYLESNPAKRHNLLAVTSKTIKTFEEFTWVLSLGDSSGFSESFDGVLSLITEVGNFDLMMKASGDVRHRALLKTLTSPKDSLVERMTEILILSIAYSHKVLPHGKETLLSFLADFPCGGKIWDTVIIDAWVLIQDELGLAKVTEKIEKYLSSKDSFVRDYAVSSIKELSLPQLETWRNK